MELVLVHITDIHLENDTDYNILEGRSEYIANAINKHIIDVYKRQHSRARIVVVKVLRECRHWRMITSGNCLLQPVTITLCSLRTQAVSTD